MAFNRFEEARSMMQRALDVKADNMFVHELLFDLAFLNNESDGMQQQLKWAEGKSGE
jgi:hypothetical protein